MNIFKPLILIFDIICNIAVALVFAIFTIALVIFFILNVIWNYLHFKKPGQLTFDYLICSQICFFIIIDIFWLPFIKGVVHTAQPIETNFFIRQTKELNFNTYDGEYQSISTPTYFFLRKSDFAFYKLRYSGNTEYEFVSFSSINIFQHLRDIESRYF